MVIKLFKNWWVFGIKSCNLSKTQIFQNQNQKWQYLLHNTVKFFEFFDYFAVVWKASEKSPKFISAVKLKILKILSSEQSLRAKNNFAGYTGYSLRSSYWLSILTLFRSSCLPFCIHRALFNCCLLFDGGMVNNNHKCPSHAVNCCKIGVKVAKNRLFITKTPVSHQNFKE